MVHEAFSGAWAEIERSIRERVRTALAAQAESIRVSVPHMRYLVESLRAVPGVWNPAPEQRDYFLQFLDWTEKNVKTPTSFAAPFVRYPYSQFGVNEPEMYAPSLRRILTGKESDPAHVASYQHNCAELAQQMADIADLYDRPDLEFICWDFDPDAAPPRHAVLRAGVSARALTEDLRELDARGLTLGSGLWEGTVDLDEAGKWRTDVERQLLNFEDRRMADEGFRGVTKPLEQLRHPMVENPRAVASLAVGFGIEYLRKVVKNMPDYAAGSGQGETNAGTTFNFSNSTINGGQFAQTIRNTDTVIAAVATAGQPETAQALKAIKEALLADAHLDDAQRTELLDNLAYLSEEAVKDPGERRAGVLRTIIGGIQAAAASGSALQQAMTTWGGVIGAIVP